MLEQSRRNNPRQGITGILCCNSEQFIQVLEGGRDEVCELYNTIARDPRHLQVRILVYEEIAERRFGGWTMGQVEIDKVNPSLLLKYAERAELNPFTASGRASSSTRRAAAATRSSGRSSARRGGAAARTIPRRRPPRSPPRRPATRRPRTNPRTCS